MKHGLGNFDVSIQTHPRRYDATLKIAVCDFQVISILSMKATNLACEEE
jgi:hypothetical protein